MQLCEGAPVILTANVRGCRALLNGRRGKVVKLDDTGPTIMLDANQKTYKLQKHTFTVYSKHENKDVAVRKQFPICLGFACTAHRAQGITLDEVVVHSTNIRNPGQIGVAVGR